MSKEMTTEEVKAYTAQFNHQNLLNRFNYLTEGMENWKMPFCAVIPEKDYEAYNEAAIYFTGAKLERRCYVDKTEDGPRLFVECEGYYNAVGA